ncbi:MAG: DEAD/DEAH box helicase [Candidatus Heimdallarchaeum endolithica]|uniref:DEAD/DEAH box helicase n=1 Tax=Candidatus Heimdallarchaeum endolithica TaxID=2876572 RepID=A0A9Y1BQ06_9ARCH|nr:MAG: DEAD/DEAH box helicase [Candidatus Heimdallarchaeum endolithica]
MTHETSLAIEKMGFTTLTDIQEQAIPLILERDDTHVLAQAKTGTGKTLSFAIPLVEKLYPKKKIVQAVIIVPTRELCKQVHSVIRDVSRYRRFKTVEVYGGVSINRQIEKIESGAQIVIATPGRLIDLYYREAINLDNVRFAVLDEADKMLDMGFFPDIEFILFEAMKNARPHLMLFSATIIDTIREIAFDFTIGQKLLEIDVSHDSLTVESCEQYYYKVNDQRHKYSTFKQILKKENPKFSIIFVNTKRMANILTKRLRSERDLSLRVDMLHGDMTQKQREIVTNRFRKKQLNCLIATNVAARGLDFPHITHIFNYDIPDTVESYVHRVGRTSRMGSSGTAISLVVDDGKQLSQLYAIEQFIDLEIKRKHIKFSKTENSGSENKGKRYNNNSSNRQKNKGSKKSKSPYYKKVYSQIERN